MILSNLLIFQREEMDKTDKPPVPGYKLGTKLEMPESGIFLLLRDYSPLFPI